MAISEFEIQRIEKLVGEFVEKRRPERRIRPQLDIGFRIMGQSFEIFEIRPRWDDPQEKIETPVAKATYVKSQKEWKLFWLRKNHKWHGYPPLPRAQSLENILDEIGSDPHGCFWG